jgi:hypothetical protein
MSTAADRSFIRQLNRDLRWDHWATTLSDDDSILDWTLEDDTRDEILFANSCGYADRRWDGPQSPRYLWFGLFAANRNAALITIPEYHP